LLLLLLLLDEQAISPPIRGNASVNLMQIPGGCGQVIDDYTDQQLEILDCGRRGGIIFVYILTYVLKRRSAAMLQV